MIIATCTSEKVFNQLALNWGVLPTMAALQKTPDELYRHAIICALNTGAAISLVMMVLILISLGIMNKFSDADDGGIIV